VTLLSQPHLPRGADKPGFAERIASPQRGRIELATFYRGVHQRAASAAGIADVEWKSIAELREELATRFPKIARMVADFIDAYDCWYSIHEGLERISPARLSMQQQKALADAVVRRDETRGALIAELQQ
jgi:hypothetical protein